MQMAGLLLAASQIVGLLLIPFGLPGTWVQVLGIVGYAWMTGFQAFGVTAIVIAIVLAIIAEVLEFTLGGKYAKRYGGSRRAGWGAILGGIAGALMGLPVPIVGSVIGAFVGAFVGAAVLEMTKKAEWRSAVRVGWGAFLGRLVAVAMKSGIGVAIAAAALLSALG